MLKLLVLLTQQLNGIFSSDGFSKKDSVETKKCRNCLRRVKLDKYRCTYCGSSDFQIDEK